MSTPKRFRFTNQLIKSLPLTHPMHAVPMPNTATLRFPASSVWSAEEKVVKVFATLPLSWTKTRHRHWSLA